MTWFILFPHSLAFDRYCRQQMQGFSMAPLHPLSDADLMAASQQQIPLGLRFHDMRAPIAASLGTVAVGSLLFTALPHSPGTSASPGPASQPVTETIDTLRQDLATTIVAPQESETPQTVPAAAPSRLKSEKTTETLASDSLQPSEDPTPVVVKKIVRKRQQTVIIQDTTKQ